MKELITICTPTYNRGYLLGNLYDSIEKQVKKNFNWLIVDDGSNDNTKEVVDSFIKKASFKIEYIKKDNGGKHSALNIAIDKAETELFFIVDSDDELSENATKHIEHYWETIEEKSSFAGVAGLKGNKNKEVIGTCSEKEFIDATTIEYEFDYGYVGDKAEVYRTDILKKYKFPEIEGEKFLTEAVVWNRIAEKGLKIRWFKEIITIVEYLEDGLSSNYRQLLLDNFQGTKIFYNELINNKALSLKIRYVDLSYIYLKLADKKGYKKEALNGITNNILERSFISLIYILKEIKRGRKDI